MLGLKLMHKKNQCCNALISILSKSRWCDLSKPIQTHTSLKHQAVPKVQPVQQQALILWPKLGSGLSRLLQSLQRHGYFDYGPFD